MIRKNLFKKMMVFTAGMMIASLLVGCGMVKNAFDEVLNKGTDNNEAVDIVIDDGGYDYSNAIGVGVPDDIEAAFNQAIENYDGQLVPLTVLSQQVVAGMNYNILCKDEANNLKSANIYVDLENNGGLSGVYDVYLTESKTQNAKEEPVSGGWGAPTIDETLELEGGAKDAFEKAFDGFVGSTVEPVAYLGEQIVAGTNYKYVCKVTPVAPDAYVKLQVVVVYVDLDGNASVTGFYDIH